MSYSRGRTPAIAESGSSYSGYGSYRSARVCCTARDRDEANKVRPCCCTRLARPRAPLPRLAPTALSWRCLLTLPRHGCRPFPPCPSGVADYTQRVRSKKDESDRTEGVISRSNGGVALRWGRHSCLPSNVGKQGRQECLPHPAFYVPISTHCPRLALSNTASQTRCVRNASRMLGWKAGPPSRLARKSASPLMNVCS